MSKIYFVRHGESHANIGGLSMRDQEIPLTENGHQQASDVARFLKSKFLAGTVFTSELKRAQETATHYCELTGLQYQVSERLNEMRSLDYEFVKGMYGEQRRAAAMAYWAEADPLKRTGAHSDNFLDFSGRVSRFLTELMPELPENTICFGHGMWIGMLIWQVLGFSASDSNDMLAYRKFQGGLPMNNCIVYEFSRPAVSNCNWSITHLR